MATREKSRATVCAEALWSSTAQRGKGSQRTRQGRRLVIQEVPTVDHQDRGIIVLVRLYDAASGSEIPVDPLRHIRYPPPNHNGTSGPLESIWSILWESVLETPNPAGWWPA